MNSSYIPVDIASKLSEYARSGRYLQDGSHLTTLGFSYPSRHVFMSITRIKWYPRVPSKLLQATLANILCMISRISKIVRIGGGSSPRSDVAYSPFLSSRLYLVWRIAWPHKLRPRACFSWTVAEQEDSLRPIPRLETRLQRYQAAYQKLWRLEQSQITRSEG